MNDAEQINMDMLETIKKLQRWVGKYVADEMHNHELAKKDLDYSYEVIAKAEGRS